MGEWADAWAAEGVKNLWGTVPSVFEMQSEGGAAGAIHGALQTGSLSTTFTASQGLLLMIPNMYKIAGELTPVVLHVAARSLATHALSIFGDHSDVMAVRATGFGMLCSASVQEAQDFAVIAQAVTLESRIPFVHFFDGFRTSHEISKIEMLTEELLREMIDERWVLEHRRRALTPDRPVIRGTSQNPDVYFQAREAANPFYARCPGIVQQTMDKFARLTGRKYKLFEYVGDPNAKHVIVLMGSGCEAVHETIDYLNAGGAELGLLKVRLYRPFDSASFIEALPASVRAIAVLDRTKEPCSDGEPLYLDCVNAIFQEVNSGAHKFERTPKIVGGRYGLSSKEFTPGMIKAVFDNLAHCPPKNNFTISINDDVTHTSLEYDPHFSVEQDETFRAIFYGLGSDGTVGANKDSIKIIGENTGHFAQGYFVYDSKKSGAMTVSHLRFGPRPIRSTYLVSEANFLGCHQPQFLSRADLLDTIAFKGVFLLNTPNGPGEVWTHLPQRTREQILEKQVRFYVIDAHRVARECGMRGRINTVMQTAFFGVSGVLPQAEAIAAIKDSICKTYAKKGEEIVNMNLRAVDMALAHVREVKVPDEIGGNGVCAEPSILDRAPAFVRNVLGELIAGRGDAVPVSRLPCDGTFPTGTARWEKRNLAAEIPVWDPDVCIQCGKCVFVCPHSTIRSKLFGPDTLNSAPETFKSRDARAPEWKGFKYTIQVAPEDCTGCGLCADICPARNKSEAKLKALNMRPQPPLRDSERVNWEFFLGIPGKDVKAASVRDLQWQQPLFEFSGACAGCGETPYLRTLTQLFGDRLLIANATGCSSIYGGNLPTTPWSTNNEGRGPAWANSLFEDNAEFGLGFRVSLDKQREFAAELLEGIAWEVGEDLAARILVNKQQDEAAIHDQRELVAALKEKLVASDSEEARRLLSVADALVKKSVWIVGGDGWAYDIGFGGLDHVLASGRNVKVLVLDTEVYSNTGGQMSKSTPRGAVAKFASGGKTTGKKDLGLLAMSYGNVYVASVAMGAKDEQTLKAFLEAEAYDGPALILAYSHCIAHGIEMSRGLQDQKAAVQSGHWLMYRFHPDRIAKGENPLVIDSLPPKLGLREFFQLEGRFKLLAKNNPEHAHTILAQAQADVESRWRHYQAMAGRLDGKPPQPNASSSVPIRSERPVEALT